MSSGIYYSRLEGYDEYLWAFMIPSEEHPAHFGSKAPIDVICLYLTSNIGDWSHSESESKFCVLPERVLKWQ